MNTASNSVDACAICLGRMPEGLIGRLTCFLLPAFARQLLRRYSVLTLKPCSHHFHHRCISQWLNESPRCPLDRRIITSSDPPGLLSINLAEVLLNSIENNQIGDVQEILLAGSTPEQLSCSNSTNPLTMALTNERWEIAAQLIRAGWTTEDRVAANNLGWLYRTGLVVEQNCTKALLYYRKAADQGYPIAQNNLGLLYQKGLGVKQDYNQALSWYLKAASQGDTDAEKNLGFMYQMGLGVERSYALARFWYRKAAEQGNAVAQNSLARLYQRGQGGERNYANALFWFHKSADQGNFTAQHQLGRMHEYALGLKRNLGLAMFWYNKAAEQGHTEARSKLNLLQKGSGKF